MPSANTINLQSLIYQEALSQGVDPAIAMAVAQKESSTSQWNPDGSLVTGTSGEIGVFQLMPATAAGLGVDPSNLEENIQGGIAFLGQLFSKYGNWPAALSAYNSGSPNGSPRYASSVLAIASSLAPAMPATPDTTSLAPAMSFDAPAGSDMTGDGTSGLPSGVPLVWVAGAAVGGAGLLLWLLR